MAPRLSFPSPIERSDGCTKQETGPACSADVKQEELASDVLPEIRESFDMIIQYLGELRDKIMEQHQQTFPEINVACLKKWQQITPQHPAITVCAEGLNGHADVAVFAEATEAPDFEAKLSTNEITRLDTELFEVGSVAPNYFARGKDSKYSMMHIETSCYEVRAAPMSMMSLEASLRETAHSNYTRSSEAGVTGTYVTDATNRTSLATRASRESSCQFLDPISRWELLAGNLLWARRETRHILRESWNSMQATVHVGTVGHRISVLDKIEKLANDPPSQVPSFTERAVMRFLPVRYLCPNGVITHPNSTKRTIWLVLCSVFLLYDFIMTPIHVFFDVPVAIWIGWIFVCFWTIDIILSFKTGIYVDGSLEMRPARIAAMYTRRWFCLDAVLVLSDLFYVLMDDLKVDEVAGMRSLVRGLRFMRLLRLLRTGKLSSKLKEALWVYIPFVSTYAVMVKYVIGTLLCLHFLACAWYKAGTISQNGWVKIAQVNGDEPLAHIYIYAVFWAVTQLHGWSDIYPQSNLERAFASVVDVACFFFFIIVMGKIHLILSNMNEGACDLQTARRRFLSKHKMVPELSLRMRWALARSRNRSLHTKQLEEELAMIQQLPKPVRQDLLWSAYGIQTFKTRFFKNLQVLNPLLLRRICEQALQEVLVFSGDVVFVEGDMCHSMLVVASGFGRYTMTYGTNRSDRWTSTASMNEAMMSRVFSNERSESGLPGRNVHSIWSYLKEREPIAVGRIICEAVLWTPWTHRGKLICPEDGTFIALDVHLFENGIVKQTDSLVQEYALTYAKAYVTKINKTDFDKTRKFSDVDTLHVTDEDLFVYAAERMREHWVFLSHYKVEAGTEATLMQEALNKMIRVDPTHPGHSLNVPVFVDSECLNDLSKLKEHVIHSRNLVILLTPGYLSRPWCLLEVVQAIAVGVQLVPVEVQRPGVQFVYPDEGFYDRLREGQILDTETEQFMEEQGVSLEQIASSIRQIFLKIALPFSPHKSTNVRNAEMQDILKRCQID